MTALANIGTVLLITAAYLIFGFRSNRQFRRALAEDQRAYEKALSEISAQFITNLTEEFAAEARRRASQSAGPPSSQDQRPSTQGQ